ncbi:substrate-binding domain-containing protein [Solirubrobacter soli]|uniref:substrate-binding domain-containing protein n=1 Tax=Solirubrobacter soli TaxID=363832 RepID=UPI0004143D02|nr:substrate-binding domain-containing protein [Solirubrobacter soli]
MRRSGWVAAVMAAGLALPTAASADNIRIESTTDTVDAGLVTGLLENAYKAAQPGDTIAYHAVGTGAALTNARNGLADVVITHAPSLEDQFVKDGYSLGLGRQIFYSDYVIVGPKDDPAGVAAKHPHDAVGAFEDIAAAGAADSTKVRFRSRADNSGTNVQEQIMWGLSTITKQKASNAPALDTTRFEPGTGGTYPDWYVRQSGGQAENLGRVEACVVAGNGCYTMLDRGTFNKQVNDGVVTHLKIVAEKNTAAVRGGENLLINPFSVYIVNPAKFAAPPIPNVAAATRFVNFLVSPGFQASLLGFPNAVDPAFLPNAFPSLTLDTPLPQVAAPGDTIELDGVAKNRLPGGVSGVVNIKDLPVQLQQSTDDGSTWKNIGGPVQTDANGAFSLTTAIGRTTRYRFSTGAAPASTYNQFSPSTQDLGVVAIPTPQPTVSPTPTPTPTVVPPKDTTRPTVSTVSLTRRGVSLKISEGGTIKLVIERKAAKGNKFTKVQTVTLKSTAAKTVKGTHKALKAGKYRLQITATDLAGNKRELTRNFTLI